MPALLLALNDDPDVAGSASAVEDPALGREVVVLSVGWFPLAAAVAASLPASVGSAAVVGTVEPLVREVVDEFEVGKVVVLLVLVDVVDLESGRDRAVGLFPHPVVNEAESSSEVGAVVALGSGVAEPRGVATGRSSFTHCGIVSQTHPSSPAERSALDVLAQ